MANSIHERLPIAIVKQFGCGPAVPEFPHRIWQSPIVNTHTTSFNTEGTALCLWTEAVPLHELCRLQIGRATKIEFNNASQQWEVKDRKGKNRFFAKSRSACLEWEQQNLQPE
jgi:hypothetical protein